MGRVVSKTSIRAIHSSNPEEVQRIVKALEASLEEGSDNVSPLSASVLDELQPKPVSVATEAIGFGDSEKPSEPIPEAGLGEVCESEEANDDSGKKGTVGGVLPWRDDADPEALVEAARGRIEALILEGIEKPSEIGKMIWGSVVNTTAKPYNGKYGVKKRIDFIVSELKKK